MLSKGKKVVIVVILLVLAFLAAVYIYVAYLRPNSTTQGFEPIEETALKTTKGSDIGFSANETASVTEPLSEPLETTMPVSDVNTDEYELQKGLDESNVKQVIKNKQSLLREETHNANWYYGTLTEEAPLNDIVVVFEYEALDEVPSMAYLYDPTTDIQLEPTYFNDNLDGELAWEIDTLNAGTYAVFIELAYEGQNVGRYSCYTMPKEDYDNMHAYFGMLAPDDEE